MNKRVTAFIEENRLLNNGDTVIAAVSGGMDSVTLLHILYSIKELFSLKLHAAHLNHGIRGEEADRDEAFVRELCESMGIPLHVRRADIPAIAAECGKSEELCGREARYAFFDELSDRFGAKIATAHNRDDNAETVLWNLVRGSGLGGLCGIPVVRGSIIRPLLCCSRTEIEAYQRAYDLRYVTDSTNLEALYTRNKIRLEVMPLLRQLNENADGNIVRMAQIAHKVDAYLGEISEKELKSCKVDGGYDCQKLLQLDDAVRGYALRRIADDAGASMDYAHVALVTEAMADGGAVELGSGYTAVCAQGILRIVCGGDRQPAVDSVPLKAYHRTVRLQIRDGRIFRDGIGIPRQKVNNLFVNNLIPCDIITDDTMVRTRREGDAFSDSRRGVTKSIKKLFNELKIPREKRDSVLLAANGSRVIWIDGVGCAERVDLSRDQEVIYITSHCEAPERGCGNPLPSAAGSFDREIPASSVLTDSSE